MQAKIFRYLLVSILSLGITWVSTTSKSTQAAIPPFLTQQPLNSYKLLFVGDIMTHGPQIKAAKTSVGTDGYDFSRSFDSLAPRLRAADLTIGNLETTLGVPPYSGYPMFSSPASLAIALREVGFDVLTTANNHSADRSGRGIVRTLDILDSLEIQHTGSYRRQEHRSSQTPLVLSLQEDISVGILAYTYGTNGLKVPPPTYVDLIDTAMIAQDIEAAHLSEIDFLIVQIHWGQEYQREPTTEQKELAQWLHRKGVNAVIGSHPHVVQRSEWLTEAEHPTFVLYSLGNFISNQIKPAGTRAGLMLTLELTLLPNRELRVSPSYEYVFVNKHTPQGEAVYRLLPMSLDLDATLPELSAKEQEDWRAARSYYRGISLDYQPQTYQLKTNDYNE